ncbi:MAG: electron transfer flavoprotein subunit beta/FixA family protein [Thermoproteota archaeon]|jgi:electron transfer flavoprotein beta subunit|nr:electron transfer flavoprotein subunit beta/FixA family protein [Thermoproteota archaeon]
MNIAVFVKPSLDLSFLKIENNRVLIEKIPLTIGDFDKVALEEAIRIKEKIGAKVFVFLALTWGPIDKRTQEIEKLARECLAMGADEAHLLIDERLINSTTLEITEALCAMIKKLGNFDIYFASETSSDMSSYQFASRLATLLNIPVITFARRIVIENNSVIVERDLEDRTEVVECNLPCFISVTGEMNQPRKATVRQILQAKTKPLYKHRIEDPIDSKQNIDFEILVKQVERKRIIIEGDINEIADRIVDILKDFIP